ncbi:ABC transporter ATP-binding protein [Corallococcus exercitus]|uniref:ABC transporter ATP-binding protein n=2 Tax=Corallococcus exercitus TaxID=2316736 RepID=A0A7Y4KJN5_9BACT|nr:ABC transporter ATP-binding protein [Corallococcus exercitus]
MRKTYRRAFGRGGHEALKGMDLHVPAGSAFGLIGPNGAGKTTFIKSVLGIVRPSAGTVRVLGGSPEDPAIRARIGYLPERLHLPGTWKSPAFLATVARLKGLKADAGAHAKLLERVGLSDAVDRRIGGYSKGMRQRLGLAAALLGEPALLVLDEPTDGIDPMGRLEVRRILQEEVQKGVTLFLNSHLLAETERVCDRVAILADGRVLREGRLDELAKAGARWRVRFAPGADTAALGAAGFMAVADPARGAAAGGASRTGAAPAGGGREDGVYMVDAADVAVLNAALDRARASGALLMELKREGADLEAVLVGAVGGPGVAA